MSDGLRASGASSPEMAVSLLEAHGKLWMLWLHTQRDPPTDQWQAAINRILERKREHQAAYLELLGFVISDGGTPNSAQRAQLFQTEIAKHPVCVVTNSLNNPVKRGIATAISWLNPEFLALPPDRSAEGLAHVGWAGDVLPMWREFCELQTLVPPVQSLVLFGQVMSMPLADLHSSYELAQRAKSGR